MKKLLLGTTMLVGAAVMSSGAMAQAPNPVVSAAPFQVTLRGFTTNSFENINEKQGGVYPSRRTAEFRTQNRISILADAKADNGLMYGVFDRIDLGTNGAAKTVSLNRNFGYVQGSFGRIEFGQRNGVVDDVLGGSCGGGFMFGPCTGEGAGQNGDLVIDSMLNSSPGSLDVLTSHAAGANFGANRILYRSPVISGFQLDLGYTPNADGENGRGGITRTTKFAAGDLGTGADAGHLGLSGYHDYMEAVLEYKDTFGPVGVDISVGGDYATPKNTVNGRTYNTIHELSTAWHFTYGGFGFQVLFNDSFDSQYTKRAITDASYKADDQWGGTVNLDYTVGPYTVGAWYSAAGSSGDPTKPGSDSWRQIGVGGHYILAKGLMLFGWVEFDTLKTDQVSAGFPNNSPTAIVLGSQILF